MFGVDEFRNTKQAMESREKALRRNRKTDIVPLLTAIAVSLVWYFIYGYVIKWDIPDAIQLIIVCIIFAGEIALYFYTEAWFYLLKLATLPIRKVGTLGLMFLLAAIFAYLAYIAIYLVCVFYVPVVPLLYEKYLCKVTLDCTEDISNTQVQMGINEEMK